MKQLMNAEIIILLQIVFLASSSAYIPLFIRGRPTGGFIGAPDKGSGIKEDIVLPADNWFEQRLNHFDHQDSRTWKQRYFVNESFFDRANNGPVFLMIGGEGKADPIWAVMGDWIENAKDMGALCFLLEHRFYGKSHPLGDMSVENLQYLSSEQALADLASFRQAMHIKYKLTNANKWISFGGSYPGALSAWFRLKYPHLVHGSIASSAPIKAVVDFSGYFDVVANSLATTGSACNENIAAATKMIASLIQTDEGCKNLTEQFRLCKPLKKEMKLDLMNFANTLAGNFAGVVQYNKDNRVFEGAKGVNITIDVLCGIMNASTNPPLKRYAAVNDLMMATYGMKCLDTAYEDFTKTMKQTSWQSSASEGGRQWMYQTCTEFGYYQSSDSVSQPFGSLFPLSFSIQQCVDIFGRDFNLTFISESVNQTNINYGGFSYEADKVVFVNGDIDPWHALSFSNKAPSYVTTIFISGTAHCANMYPGSTKDPASLVAARHKVKTILKHWLNA
eukprot:gene11360-12544_t